MIVDLLLIYLLSGCFGKLPRIPSNQKSRKKFINEKIVRRPCALARFTNLDLSRKHMNSHKISMVPSRIKARDRAVSNVLLAVP